MPDPDVEHLVRETAERVAAIVLAGSDRDRQAVVDRAVRDANVDRDLRDHARHLAEINGSQAKMATSLEEVESTISHMAGAFDKQVAVTKAIGEYVKQEKGVGISRRVVWISLAAAIAAYLTIIALIVLRFA